MSEAEFSGIGLALGVVTGARSFKIDKLGRLTGIHYNQVWKPGENESECRKKADSVTMGTVGGFTVSMDMSRLYSTLSSTYSWSDPYGIRSVQAPTPTLPATIDPKPAKVKKPKPVEPKPHDMSTCQCGFYGYYDGSNDYYQRGYVSGIVEGYGEALIGTRGFRVCKARIVALRIPKSTPAPLAALVRRNYAEIPQFEKFSAMVAAFPCDGGELASTPETDDDFWTRSA